MALPAVLLPYQAAWAADRARVRIWEKSRRIGASWTCAFESVIEAGRETGGSDTWYTSYNKETTQEFIRDCSWWIEMIHGAIAGVEEVEETDPNTGEQILTFVIRFPTGHKITALSSKPANLRNRKGRIIIDEAAHIPDLKESMKAAMAVLMWGGRVDILSTHNGVDSEFNAIINEVKAKKRNYSLHRTDIDEAVSQGLYRRICLVTGEQWSAASEKAWLAQLLQDYGEDADEELRCVPRRSGGTYLSRLIVEDQMIAGPVLRFEAPDGFASRPDDQRQSFMKEWLVRFVAPQLAKLPKNDEHFFGEDFGRTADLTVIAPCTLTQKLRRMIPFLLELRDTPFREQEMALFFVVDRLPRFGYGALDATGNGQYLAERAWQRYGEQHIEQVHLSNKWYGENLPPLKAAFEDDGIDVPKDADVLSDLLSFQVIDGVPKLPDARKQTIGAGIRKRVSSRHGDAGIAIALAHYATGCERPSYDGYKSADKRTPSATAPRSWGGFRSSKGGIL